jgi:hypothetical protein
MYHTLFLLMIIFSFTQALYIFFPNLLKLIAIFSLYFSFSFLKLDIQNNFLTFSYFTIYTLFDSHLLIPSTLFYQKLFPILAILCYSSFNTFSREFVWFTAALPINIFLHELNFIRSFICFKFSRIYFFFIVYFVFGIFIIPKC